MAECDGLRAAADRLTGTGLEAFLRGFEECGFRIERARFVEGHVGSFAALNPDGSQPLEWTRLHGDYKALFDAHLDTILEYHPSACIEREDFLRYCQELHAASQARREELVAQSTGGASIADFELFLAAITASEEYEEFLKVMLAAARWPADAVRRLCAPEPPAAAAEEVEVRVPEGYAPGQLLPIDVLGCRYEVAIPQGCGPGGVFRAALAPRAA